ncbi:hypothetical protein [Streptomyces sp. UNOC14_S4]|uniref:hypothetical protein n=1 Tax=Streptomyces sp. UNOC14_S4 TaxID=2872340 RepID=UPI001E5DA674|nr:hypothetical protein [Streptomyces sp. UNOC14_S4]MCC3768423.1 hypothetical protein [Streptomyces sp. UNOC14_S4]
MRKAVQYTGAALIAAVLMTGCGSGGGGSTSGKSDKADAGKDTAGPPTATARPSSGRGRLDGVYGAHGDDGAIGLSVYQGKAVVYANNGQRVCTGTVAEEAKPMTLALTCADGNKERSAGTVEQAEGTTLVVSWGGGRKDTFTRTADSAPLPAPKKLGG